MSESTRQKRGDPFLPCGALKNEKGWNEEREDKQTERTERTKTMATVLKKQAKQVMKQLNDELAVLKKKEMTKEEKRHLQNAQDKLYWAWMAESMTVTEERVLEEKYHEMVQRMAKNELGLNRIAELQQLIKHLKEPGLDWEDESETTLVRLIVKTILG